MGGRRRATWVALLVALACASGCLDSPAPAGNGTGDGDGDGDDVGDDGGGSGGQPDAGSCQVLVTSAFDGPDWTSLEPVGTAVERAASWARVRATPSTDVYVYGDLHTERQELLDGAVLTVEVDAPIVSVTGQVGIAWHNFGSLDSYQLEVADGTLRARRMIGTTDEIEVCLEACPAYSAVDHTRLRLRERDGYVHYQVASDGGDWVDVGVAPAIDLPYTVLLYASATGPGSGDVTVTAAEWLACSE